MSDFPRLILVILPVEWPIFMRHKAIFALAQSVRRFGSTVVALNRPLCPFTTVFRKRQRMGELFGKAKMQQLDENLYLYSPRYFIHDHIAGIKGPLAAMNLFALRRSVRNIRKRLEMESDSTLIWYYLPYQTYFSRLISDAFVVLELYDSLLNMDGKPNERVNRLEEAGRDGVDLLLWTSDRLMDIHAPNYKSSARSHNGLARDTMDALTNEAIMPSKLLEGFASPIIGYAGIVSHRLNWRIICKLAEHRPGWNFVFVGSGNIAALKRSFEMPTNVHFPGGVEHSFVPSVLKAFDVGIMPYNYNEYFDCLNPLKFYEYAAAGLPIVSSRIPELRTFPPQMVQVAENDPESWASAIETVLESEETATRFGPLVASQYLWEDLADRLVSGLCESLGVKFP